MSAYELLFDQLVLHGKVKTNDFHFNAASMRRYFNRQLVKHNQECRAAGFPQLLKRLAIAKIDGWYHLKLLDNSREVSFSILPGEEDGNG